MTNEEAKKRLEVRMICANCPEDKMCYDSHLHSICEYTDYCDEVPIEEAVKVAIEVLGQQPCEDAISRREAISIAGIATLSVNQVVKALEGLPPVSSSEKPNRSEWEQDHEILKAHSDGANYVLDMIRAEIENKYESIPDTFHHYETGFTDALEWVLSIIDKYKAEEDKA